MTRLPAEQRREQLLDTAVTLFATKGFSGATTAELARAAGVTEPIIYRHFKSKKDLFIAVIERTSDLTMGVWERQLRSAKDSAQRLRRLIAANPTISDRGRGIYRAIIQAMTEIEDPDIKAALQHHVGKLHRFVTDEVIHAQEEGEVSKAFSPEITAWTLMHLGLGYGVLAPLGIEGHAIDDRGVRVRTVIEYLMLSDKARARQDKLLKEHKVPGDGETTGDIDG